MKKITAVLLAAAMLLVLAACGKPEEKKYQLNMGAVLQFSQPEEDGESRTAVAALVLDGADRIVRCSLTAKGYEARIPSVEEAVTGKNAEEVKNLGTGPEEPAFDGEEKEWLRSAVLKAFEDENGFEFLSADDFLLGTALTSRTVESASANEEDSTTVRTKNDFSAVAVSPEGKILAAVTDASDPVVRFAPDGTVTDTIYKGTNREQGFDYGMVAYGGAIAEWDAQARSFCEHIIGKTANEVRFLPTKTNERGKKISAESALLTSCTMEITGMVETAYRAAESAD